MIDFRMSRIKVDQFAILAKDLPNGDVGFNSYLSFNVNPAIPEIKVTTKCEMVNQEILLVVLELSCTFEVRKDNWNSLIDNGNIVLPKEFLAHIAMHTVGTARGVLYSKTEDTMYSQFILPPTDVLSKIAKDLTVAVQTESSKE